MKAPLWCFLFRMRLKRIYRFHKWSGLIAGCFIFLLSLTGSLLVFHQELDDLQYRQYLHAENDQAVSIDKAYESIVSRYSTWDIRLIRFSDNPSETLVFQLRRPDDRLMVFVHPSSGELIKVVPQSDSAVFWVLKLHYSLHAGIAGETIIFLAGILFAFSLFTGLFVYRKMILKTLLFRTRFNTSNKNTLSSSLHRYVGVWAVLFNLIMALSGLVISYEILIAGLKGTKPAILNSPAITTVSIDKILNEYRAQNPAFNPSYIRFPTKANDKINISGALDNKSKFYSKFYNVSTADIHTGELSPVISIKPLPAFVRGLHFIEYGNWSFKLLFLFVGLTGPVLSITGYVLWKRKQNALCFS